ncbi:MAG: hypothetical protein RL285_1856, partial [Bacteroidota bacterium]
QTQKQDPIVGVFKTPVDIECLYADGSSEKRTLWIDQQQQTLRFPSLKKPVTVVFDAGSHILKSLVMKKTLDEWIWQFSHGNSMLDRYDALVALRDFQETAANPSKAWKAQLLGMSWLSPAELKSTWGLTANLPDNEFREMQAEIASQWFALFDRSSQTALSEVDRVMFAKFANSVHAPVRRVLYERLPFQPAFRELFLQGLKDSSYNNVEFLVDRLWNSTPLSNDQTAVGISRAEILEAIKGEQGHLHNLKIKYLECAYQYAKSRSGNSAENDAQTYINLLKDMAGPYYEFRTRTTAMSALKRLGYLDAQLSQNLFDAFLNFNSRLAGPAGDVIKYFAQNSANKALLLEQIRQYKTADSNTTLAAQNRLFKLLQ